MNDKTKDRLIIILACIIAVLCVIIAFVLGMNFANKEEQILNDTSSEEKDNNSNLNQVINCNGSFMHQYGEGTHQKKYLFSNDELQGLEVITKYAFGTEELASNMNVKMNNCGQYDESVDCKSIQEDQYVIVTVNINKNNLNNTEYLAYKNLTINDVLNNNIDDNNIFNNYDMTCEKK